MMGRYYLLDENHQPVPTDLMTWARMFEKDDVWRVAADMIGECHVSTVFLGLDHGFDATKPPVLFETMTFGGPLEQEQERYCTWDEAMAGHAAMCAKVRAAMN